MVRVILFLGLAFWSSLAFFGTRSNLEKSPDSALAGALRKLKTAAPGGLIVPGLLGIGLGIAATLFQIARIEAMAGVIGPIGAAGWLCAVVGAGLLGGATRID